jgi:hypothetical protein
MKEDLEEGFYENDADRMTYGDASSPLGFPRGNEQR